jgi:hypothetical protein
MLTIAFHVLLTIGLLSYQRKKKFAPDLWLMSAVWYALGSLLIFIELAVSTREFFSGLLLQGLLIDLLYVPSVFFSLRWAKEHKDGLFKPVFLFLVFALATTVVISMMMARANVAAQV